jgi:hypothetical protein
VASINCLKQDGSGVANEIAALSQAGPDHRNCISNAEYDRRMVERRAAGLLIDPSTAEIDWNYAPTLDPYGDGITFLPQHELVGREYFVRAPDSDIWVCVGGDLPDATRDAIWKRLGFGPARAEDDDVPF